MKLESKHLAPYLPYGLKGQVDNYEIVKLIGIQHFNLNYGKPFNVIDGLENWSTTNFKPILKPLSDLTEEHLKEFYQFNSIDLELIDSQEWIAEIVHMIKGNDKFQLRQFNLLFEWHFDVFGLIDKGLAIDINTLNE